MRILAAALTAAAACALAQTPDTQEIMSRVATNQAKAQELRKDYVFNQKQLLRMVRANGKIAREERREYVVTPRLHTVKKHLAKFEGKYEEHGKFTSYDKPGYHYKGLDLDADLINSMSQEMTDDHGSQDGISHNLFPLTYHEQLKYDFHFVRRETYRGREVYRVKFDPKPHHEVEHGAIWKGEALIDCAEYQPVLVTTNLALKIPLAVRTLLGTNLKGLGFTVSYAKFDDGVWFPVTYGGEFEVRGLFVYKRTMSVSLVNSDFHKVDVNSTVAYATEDK